MVVEYLEDLEEKTGAVVCPGELQSDRVLAVERIEDTDESREQLVGLHRSHPDRSDPVPG